MIFPLIAIDCPSYQSQSCDSGEAKSLTEDVRVKYSDFESSHGWITVKSMGGFKAHVYFFNVRVSSEVGLKGTEKSAGMFLMLMKFVLGKTFSN